MNNSTVIDKKDIAQRRANELLLLGISAVEDLGRRAGQDAADALKLLEGISASTSKLLDVNQRLVPLISSFQNQNAGRSFLGWFTGEQLKQDVFFDDICNQIELLSQNGQSGHEGMTKQVQQLTLQYKLMATEMALLEVDIDAGHLLVSAAYESQLVTAGFTQDDLMRLMRRISNLESMLTAVQLTRAQYLVAIQHARSIADRYHEIRTLLLPIWKQRMGFDLFSRRLNAQVEEG